MLDQAVRDGARSKAKGMGDADAARAEAAQSRVRATEAHQALQRAKAQRQ